MSHKEVETILARLANIESQQRQIIHLLQNTLKEKSANDRDKFSDLPDGITLPITSIDGLMELDRKLQNAVCKKHLV